MKLRDDALFKKQENSTEKLTEKNLPYYKVHDSTYILGIPLIKFFTELKMIYRESTGYTFQQKNGTRYVQIN